jgi:hypothetical protein
VREANLPQELQLQELRHAICIARHLQFSNVRHTCQCNSRVF